MLEHVTRDLVHRVVTTDVLHVDERLVLACEHASVNGARFYGLPLNEGSAILEKVDAEVPEEIDGIVPFHAGETLRWRVVA